MTDQAAQQDKKGQFSIQRIFTKDVSFESPNSPETFRSQWKPQVNMDLNTRSNKLGDDLYEVVLTITVTANNDEKTAFLVEVQQGGIFQIDGLEGPALHQTLGAFCPSILFPYAREVVDSLVTKGSFPALMLAPVNFEAIYAQSLQKKQEAQTQGEATH